MILSRAMTRFGLVAAAAAMVMSFGLMTAGSAQAQVLPAVLYGKGLTAGATVGASIGGTSCGTTTVNAAGEWAMQIASNASCNPTAASAAISFTINGAAATSTPPAVFQSGGTPPDVANGYKLTLTPATPTATATATATASATSTPTAAATVTATPAPPKTGNAGLLGSDGGNGGLWLLLGLGAIAAAAVAGQRVYGRRS